MQTRLVFTLFLTVLGAVAAEAGAVSPGWTSERSQSVSTAAGLFEIVSIGLGSQYRLNGRMLLESDTSSPYITASLPENAPAEYLLVGLPTGGGSCSILYQIVDLHSTPPRTTRHFGNCRAPISLKAEGETLTILFPTGNENECQSWQYNATQKRLTGPDPTPRTNAQP